MMKKLLVLSLVLAMASLASAAFELVGPTQVAPGENVTVTFVGEAGATDIYYIIVWEGDPGTLSAPIFDETNPGNNSSAGEYQEGGWGVGYEITISDTVDTANILAGDWLDLTFHCDGPGQVTIGAYKTDGGNYTEVATLVIDQVIPEPATLALLGLGALVLRRKK
jgi:hypothetical protein